MNHSPASFDDKFEQNEDPWGFTTRWYEERKRALTLAALPEKHYRRGYEPGCANGVLSVDLADRCEELVISDGSARAVALARERLAGLPHVHVLEAWLPQDWPSGSFDLIVLSELGYFLSPAGMRQLVAKALESLTPDGTLLACHWRRQADDCEWNGDGVHEHLHELVPHPLLASWTDADFRLDVWSGNSMSVAHREGLA